MPRPSGAISPHAEGPDHLPWIEERGERQHLRATLCTRTDDSDDDFVWGCTLRGGERPKHIRHLNPELRVSQELFVLAKLRVVDEATTTGASESSV